MLSADEWQKAAEGDRDIAQGDHPIASLGIYDTDEEQRRAGLEMRWGRVADLLMQRHHVVTDANSRRQLIEQLARDLPHAADKLARNADGIYSPDQYDNNRFPSREAITTDKAETTASNRTLTSLAEAWRAAKISLGKNPRGPKKMSQVMVRFAKWLGHDDATKVKRQDVVKWTDERLAEGIKPNTIKKLDVPALKAIFEWGEDRGWPATSLAKSIPVESQGEPMNRPNYFTEDEAGKVLDAALNVKSASEKESHKTTAAKRWVPLLCAYSGARVGEMIQLRRQDIRQEDGTWFMRITPEAGSTKTNKYRDVPLHDHLL